MKVEMRAQIAGTRNGVRWPAPGGVVDLPDGEARDLIVAELAVPVRGVPEVAVARQAETAAVKPAKKTAAKKKA